MIVRDPALLPGPTAGQWQGRARRLLALAVGLLLVVLVALNFGWRPHPAVLIVAGVGALAGFVAWIVLGGIALRRMRDERDRGYSTTLDVATVDLRHPRTGALLRAAGDVTRNPDTESLIGRMLRFPRGSVLANRQPPPGD